MSRSSLFSVSIASIVVACSGPDDASQSPFPLWGLRLGMPIDAVEQFFLRQDNIPWGRCDTLVAGLRACSRYLQFPAGTFEALADANGRVVRMRLDIRDPTVSELMFDEQLGAMEKGWFRVKGMRVDNGGVSDAHPVGTVVFSTARGRWTAAVTFDGHRCYGAPRGCPVRVELSDHHARIKGIP